MDGRRSEAETETAGGQDDSVEPASGDREVDEVGDESFPASDPPQWWSGRSLDDEAEKLTGQA